MNQKVFTFIEVLVIGVLILFVMVIGDTFQEPGPAPTPQATTTQAAPTSTPEITITPFATLTTPTLTQPTGLIAFNSFRDGNPEIYVVDVETGIQTNLTNNPESDQLISWSPDGSRLAFASDRTGGPEIYVMNADGAEVVQLTHTKGTDTGYFPFVSWSPDGRQILAVRHEARPGWRYALSSLDLIRSDGSRITTLYRSDEFYILHASWSPDGKYIAVTGGDSSSALQVYVGKAGEVPFSLNYFQGNPCNNYAWSPDSKITCFGSHEFVIINPDGSVNKQGPDNLASEGYIVGVVWSPDGQHLLLTTSNFASASISESRQILVVDADDLTSLLLIEVSESFAFMPGWSPDSQWIVYNSEQDGQANLYITNIYDPNQHAQLTINAGDNFSPQWQPQRP